MSKITTGLAQDASVLYPYCNTGRQRVKHQQNCVPASSVQTCWELLPWQWAQTDDVLTGSKSFTKLEPPDTVEVIWQPITWLVLTNKTLRSKIHKTKYDSKKRTTQNIAIQNYHGSVAFYETGW